jgi:bacillithiol biosynthesis cysteine-adding enzyme BshC
MFASQHIPYHDTGYYSSIVLDYLSQKKELNNFYSFSPTLDGIESAIIEKQKQVVDRATLVKVLQEQYKAVEAGEVVTNNIHSLLSDDTFTVCTAHQPNLFTGPLYFVYKILHTIKLAAHLKAKFSKYNFVPVFYMGTEDADVDELNHFTVQGKKYVWDTNQTGAVGRMLIDKKLITLIDELQHQIGVEPYGNEIIELLRKNYTEGETIQSATFKLVHHLFSKWGLVVLTPDNAELKKQVKYIFEDDLFHNKPSEIVESTCDKLKEYYDVQANPREINLFYLKENIRERFERKNGNFSVINSDIFFNEDEIRKELENYPERFSPNVILRGLFQEAILPNVAFIGGGGEIAYWLQLIDLFQHYRIPFPVLVLRNSFLIIEKHQHDLMEKLQLSVADIFRSELEILNDAIEKAGKKHQLNGEVEELQHVYDELKLIATSVDPTLHQHVEALKTRAVNQLLSLEKKMQRAERKKHQSIQRQITKLKQQLFPNGLQERIENFSGYYSKWGSGFIDGLYTESLGLDQEFTVLMHKS